MYMKNSPLSCLIVFPYSLTLNLKFNSYLVLNLGSLISLKHIHIALVILFWNGTFHNLFPSNLYLNSKTP